MKQPAATPSAPDPLAALLAEVGSATAFRVLADLLPDAAVFAVDADRNVVHWSEGARKLLGFTAQEAEGRLCLNAIRCRNCMLGCGIARYGSVSDVPLELSAATSQASEATGYLALLRRFVALLEPAAYREATLRGLVAPEVGPTRFAALHAEAESAERACAR